MLVVGVAAAAGGTWLGQQYVDRLIGKGHRSIGNLSASASGAPQNFLLVGTDSRAGLSKADLGRIQTDTTSCHCTDTVILLHVSPGQRKAVMVSIPRDLKVHIDGHGFDKLNAAYAFGGPDLTVKTVEQLTGVPINHFVSIDFAGFLKVVDKLGGVRLCNPTSHRWDDAFANLHMAANSCANMDGVHALAYVRARHIDSDFGRIGRQQAFLRAVMSKMSSGGNLVNIPKLLSIANIVSSHVQSDNGLSSGTAIALARKIGTMSSDSVDMRVFPSAPAPPACRTCQDFVLRKPEAALLMKAIAADASTLPPFGLLDGGGITLSGVRMQVRNGSGVQGAGRRVSEALAADGFTMRPAVSAPVVTDSTLAYPAALAEQARWVAALLGQQVRPVPADLGSGSTLVLTIGTSFKADTAGATP